MKAFHELTSIAAPMPAENIDTDQIIPARFLKYSRSGGYGQFLFHDQRFDLNGAEKPDFVLNRPEFRTAAILVAGTNFGCGSSREGAVYALADHGIRCVIAPSFGQIFYKNCFNNGVLAARVATPAIGKLMSAARAGQALHIDLDRAVISVPGEADVAFDIETFFRAMLLKGVDELGLTLGLEETIDDFETKYSERFGFLARAG